MIVSLPEPARWASLRPWSCVAVIHRLYEQRRQAVTYWSNELQTAMDLPATNPEKVTILAKAMNLHAQAERSYDEMSAALAQAEDAAAAATTS